MQLRLVFLKAKIQGHVALSKSYARIDNPEEHERAVSAPLCLKKREKNKI